MIFSPVVRGDLDGDGTIGLVDMLVLIGGWGQCVNPCPPTCFSDANGDCSVDVYDLLIVRGNWTQYR